MVREDTKQAGGAGDAAMKPMLLGLTGLARSGKDTVAGIMRKRGFGVYALAGPIKLALEEMFNIDWSLDNKEAVIEWIGQSPRQLAQTLGTEWGRKLVAEDIWVRCMLRAWESCRQHRGERAWMVVTDVRFDNEAEAIIAAGGQVWRVEREDAPPVRDHVSERGVNPRLVTGRIINNGTLDELEANVARWLQFLHRRAG